MTTKKDKEKVIVYTASPEEVRKIANELMDVFEKNGYSKAGCILAMWNLITITIAKVYKCSFEDFKIAIEGLMEQSKSAWKDG